ncbi:MAG: hypothetical protein PHI71_14520 [Acidiphilium sp.]|nr:hypothetical protein [Acidiphilium sp.]
MAKRDPFETLMSLYEGDMGVFAVKALGPSSIPRLRDLLFSRDRSGIFQPRCRVVEALSILGATDVLRTFLADPPLHSNPVEHAGDVAVINAAARALPINPDDDIDFDLLLGLVQTEALAGPIEQLGRFRRPEILSLLIDALGDDIARPAAGKALMDFGIDAVPALIASMPILGNARAASTPTARRRTLAGLTVIHKMIPKITKPEIAFEYLHLLHLLESRDLEVKAKVGVIILDAEKIFFNVMVGGIPAKEYAIKMLADLIPKLPWRKKIEIKSISSNNIKIYN